MSNERDALRRFQALKDARHLSEGYGVSVVVIGCEHCHSMWERDRSDSRRVTIADRLAAVEHLERVHGY